MCSFDRQYHEGCSKMVRRFEIHEITVERCLDLPAVDGALNRSGESERLSRTQLVVEVGTAPLTVVGVANDGEAHVRAEDRAPILVRVLRDERWTAEFDRQARGS